MYLAIVGLLYLIQSYLVYRPGTELIGTPETAGMAFEDLTLTAADGVRISAWYVPARGEVAGTVLWCHGNAGNMSHRIQDCVQIVGRGYNVLMFDYRGYGGSEGSPTEEGTFLDAEAAWKHLVEQRGQRPERIAVHGRSLGGSVAAHLASRHTPGALILESTFTSMPDLAADLYWWLPARWLSRFDYATEQYVRQAKCPVMVLHSREDDMIPFEHGRRLFDAASEPKRFVELHGRHNDAWEESSDIYDPAVRAFLREHLR